MNSWTIKIAIGDWSWSSLLWSQPLISPVLEYHKLRVLIAPGCVIWGICNQLRLLEAAVAASSQPPPSNSQAKTQLYPTCGAELAVHMNNSSAAAVKAESTLLTASSKGHIKLPLLVSLLCSVLPFNTNIRMWLPIWEHILSRNLSDQGIAIMSAGQPFVIMTINQQVRRVLKSVVPHRWARHVISFVISILKSTGVTNDCLWLHSARLPEKLGGDPGTSNHKHLMPGLSSKIPKSALLVGTFIATAYDCNSPSMKIARSPLQVTNKATLRSTSLWDAWQSTIQDGENWQIFCGIDFVFNPSKVVTPKEKSCAQSTSVMPIEVNSTSAKNPSGHTLRRPTKTILADNSVTCEVSFACCVLLCPCAGYEWNRQ